MPENPNPHLDDFTVKVLLVFLTAVVSIFVTILIERFKNRLLVLRKKITYQLVGLSSTTDTWGDIKITYNDGPVNNLYLYNVEIVNNTSKDAPKNMTVTFSLEPGAFFLRETGIVCNGDVIMGLKIDPDYQKQLSDVRERWFQLPDEERNIYSPIHKEVDHVTTHKKFLLPILNRKSKTSFDFLVAANIPDVPILSIGIYEPGVHMDWLESAAKNKKRLIWKNVIITLIWFGSAFPIIQYAPSVTWSVWLMFANSFLAYFLGLALTYLLKTVRVL
jgi:hypothetical protein